MDTSPIVMEQTYSASSELIWQALTDSEQMRQWYFDVPGFKPEEGHTFQFWAGNETKKFLHLCKVREAIKGRKLSHTWRYDGFPGDSLVTWELFPQGDETKLVLTHTGIETFEGDEYPDLQKNNFVQGWTEIMGTALREFVEK